MSRDVTFDENSSPPEHHSEITQENYNYLFPMSVQDHLVVTIAPEQAELEEKIEMDLDDAPAAPPVVEPVHPAPPVAAPVMEPVHQAVQVKNDIPFYGFDNAIPLRRSNHIHLQHMVLESVWNGNDSLTGYTVFCLPYHIPFFLFFKIALRLHPQDAW